MLVSKTHGTGQTGRGQREKEVYIYRGEEGRQLDTGVAH